MTEGLGRCASVRSTWPAVRGTPHASVALIFRRTAPIFFAQFHSWLFRNPLRISGEMWVSLSLTTSLYHKQATGEVVCTVPPGFGRNQTITVNVGGLNSTVAASAANSTARFDYDGPSVEGILPATGAEGTEVLVYGRNLGGSLRSLQEDRLVWTWTEPARGAAGTT